ncbi:MAG: SIS domain-containing protein [Candidatus Omnitrophica bacterium]|nr:SIS domain-containing protein [Candidatus Omnitrophota bacterium]
MGNSSKVIDEILNVFSKIKEEDFDILENAILKSRKIFIFGTGRSGFIGRCFCMRLFHLGFNSFFIGETITPKFTEEDLLILISGSGEKSLVLNFAKICKREKGKILTITSSKNNKLAKISDLVIVIPVSKSIQFGNSLFEQVTFLFFEEFIQKFIEKNKIKKDFMKERHTNLE